MQKAKADADLERLAALGDPLRWSLYEFVAGQTEPVSRDQAAAALGIARAVAAFHLDRLVRHELLEHSFARIGGRSGPGAGRPSKLYRRSAREFGITLPPRRYELVAALLAEAAVDTTGDGLNAIAESHGELIGRGRRAPAHDQLVAILCDQGYEPFPAPAGTICLRNCPFQELAQKFPGLVCAMNLALMQGLTRGLGSSKFRAVLDPAPDRCCVAFHTAEPSAEVATLSK
jgi:predicted ArsR family transcriptional regulator